jgi:hypothetical protein
MSAAFYLPLLDLFELFKKMIFILLVVLKIEENKIEELDGPAVSALGV